MNRKIATIFTAGLAFFALNACNEQKSETQKVTKKADEAPVADAQEQTAEATTAKSVIVYYSQTGTTKAVAEEFERLLDVESIELTLQNPYPSTYDSTIARTRMERENKSWPALENARLDLAAYDTVYLGYPIMFGTFAPPIYTFLDSNDLSGKVVVPFCTYGSGGRKASSRELSTLEPNAKVALSFGISHNRVGDIAVNVTEEVKTFLENLHAGKTEEMLCGGFSKQRPLNGDDLKVFKEATKEYGYLNLKPMSVATQVVAGTNYLFTCEMQAFGGALETVQVKIFKPLPNQGDPQMIGVEK